MVYNNLLECTVCDTRFDEILEGGVTGDFGMLPVAFCPTCLACMLDMAEQLNQD